MKQIAPKGFKTCKLAERQNSLNVPIVLMIERLNLGEIKCNKTLKLFLAIKININKSSQYD